MSSEFDEGPRRRGVLPLAVLVLVALLVGIAAGVWLVARSSRAQALLHLEPVATATQAATLAHAAGVRQAIAARPAAAAAPPDPALAGTVEQLSERVDDIETQARAATGDASRAEGLLVAFAARRALDRGMQLGYLESLLRERFGHTQPDAVAAILSAARQPVTLADLQTGLDQAAPALSAAGDGVGESWWQAFRRELSGMVVVRHADQPSTVPADRVARAQRLVEAGQVDGALAEILRLADHRAATGWIVAARRFLSGRGALDRIETAALLDPPQAALPAPVLSAATAPAVPTPPPSANAPPAAAAARPPTPPVD